MKKRRRKPVPRRHSIETGNSYMITARVPHDLRERIDAIAKKRRRTRTEVVVDLLTQGLPTPPVAQETVRDAAPDIFA